MRNIKDASKLYCPSCGAPVTTEVCPYCHSATGLNTEMADMEYPVIKCKEANIGFWTIGFPMIFAIAFGLVGFVGLILSMGLKLKELLFFSLFGIIGIVALIIVIIHIIRYLKIKICGKEIEATVYGYMDDNILINENPSQIVKLLVNTNEGPKFILYQLGDIKQLYKVNSKIKLKVYKDIFLIVKEQKYYF